MKVLLGWPGVGKCFQNFFAFLKKTLRAICEFALQCSVEFELLPSQTNSKTKTKKGDRVYDCE